MYNSFLNIGKDKLKELVETSCSKAEVLDRMGLAPKGGNYQTLNKYLSLWNIDSSQVSGKGWNRGTVQKQNLKDYTTNLGRKRFLILERGHKCESCRSKEWQSRPVPLELHHIDGDRNNNEKSNLQIICPNCHALTKNYRGKNIKSKPKLKKRHDSKTYICIKCEGPRVKNSKSKMCDRCYKCSLRKVERPDRLSLIKDIKNLGYCGTGRKYGVSDTAIRKWLKNY